MSRNKSQNFVTIFKVLNKYFIAQLIFSLPFCPRNYQHGNSYSYLEYNAQSLCGTPPLYHFQNAQKFNI